MKIMHVTECYDGGVSRAINTIARLAPDHEHHLVYQGASQPPSELFDSVHKMTSGLFSRIFFVHRIAKLVRADVVHAHSSWAGVYTRVVNLPTPVIYQPHCYAFEMTGGPTARIYRAVERFLTRNTDRVVVLSEHEAALTAQLSNTPWHFLPNAPSVGSDEVASPAENSTGTQVLMVGRICKQKDPQHFAELARLVGESLPGIRWVWAGDGDYAAGRAALERAGVRVMGWVEGSELVRLMQASTLYYHSARYEGFPLSVLDAARAGLPIIVRDIPAFGGSPLTKAGSLGESAEVVKRALSDVAFRSKLAAGAQELLSAMNEEAQRRSLRHLYRQQEYALPVALRADS